MISEAQGVQFAILRDELTLIRQRADELAELLPANDDTLQSAIAVIRASAEAGRTRLIQLHKELDP